MKWILIIFVSGFSGVTQIETVPVQTIELCEKARSEIAQRFEIPGMKNERKPRTLCLKVEGNPTGDKDE